MLFPNGLRIFRWCIEVHVYVWEDIGVRASEMSLYGYVYIYICYVYIYNLFLRAKEKFVLVQIIKIVFKYFKSVEDIALVA